MTKEEIRGEGSLVSRVHARVPLDALGELRHNDELLIAVIEDFSAGGAKLRLHGDASSRFFGPGWLLYSPLVGELPIEIRWRRLDEAGVSFPIDKDMRLFLDRFVRMLLRHGVGRPTEERQTGLFASAR